jgi:hypothetical protein
MQTRQKASILLILVVSQFIFLSCEDELKFKTPVPSVGFIQPNYTLSVNNNYDAYFFAEMEASEFNEAFTYPVFFRMGGTAVPVTHFTTLHATYTDADNTVYYQATMSQGIRKCAVSIRPVAFTGGDVTLTLTIAPDMQGNRYKVDPSRNTATITIKNITK